MTEVDDLIMRNLMIFALAAVIVAVAIIPAEVDADRPANEPTEPVVLCYYTSGLPNIVTTYYACPDMAIGSANIPEPTGAIHYWVRMDTGEVVTASTTFAPGTYMIKGYTVPPTPWGDDPNPEPTNPSSAPDNTLAVTAIILSVIAIITGAVAIYITFKRK